MSFREIVLILNFAKYYYLCRILSRRTTSNNMMFKEKIRQLREMRQMPQRQFAAALEIDTATYCKIEKGERDCFDWILMSLKINNEEKK
ncbi:MAG: helix-turn-helix domain-containing protein [Firmicutes bacterium]|nr:helix-turn-helix domain-containing protein [Bacillota bacterium]